MRFPKVKEDEIDMWYDVAEIKEWRQTLRKQLKEIQSKMKRPTFTFWQAGPAICIIDEVLEWLT